MSLPPRLARLALLILPILLPPGPAAAQPALVAAQAYVSSAGFAAVDPATLSSRIPALSAPLSPPEIAALILDAREAKTVWRDRILVRIGRRILGNDVLDTVEIERFNMAVPVREAAIHDTGSAASLEAFGVGPHVAWRIVTRPDGAGQAVLAAGRREYPEYEARERDCLGSLCTSLASLLGSRGAWKPVSDNTAAPAPTPYPPSVTHTDGQIDIDDETTPHTLRALMILAGLATSGNGMRWSGTPPDAPPGATTTAMIESNLSNGDGAQSVIGPVPAIAGWYRRTVIVNAPQEFAVAVAQGDPAKK